MSERAAVDEPELRDRVRDMKLHGVDADAAAPRDLRVAEPVPHGIHDAPLGRRQHVVVARATAGSSERHTAAW